MARANTERIEKYYFNEFIKHFTLPIGDIEYSDKPDLRVLRSQSNKILLGVEQTRFFIEPGNLKSSEQYQSKLRELIVEEAEAQYLRDSSGKLRLSISFNKEYPISSKDDLIFRLVSFAKQLKPIDTRSISPAKFITLPEINSLYAQWNIEAPWQLTQGHSVPLTSKDRLQEIINAKDQKATLYEKCDDLWLLVIIDFFDSAQDQDIDDSIDLLYSKMFSKVILFKTAFNTIKEIPCRKRN